MPTRSPQELRDIMAGVKADAAKDPGLKARIHQNHIRVLNETYNLSLDEIKAIYDDPQLNPPAAVQPPPWL